jgi:hypothetical protein
LIIHSKIAYDLKTMLCFLNNKYQECDVINFLMCIKEDSNIVLLYINKILQDLNYIVL